MTKPPPWTAWIKHCDLLREIEETGNAVLSLKQDAVHLERLSTRRGEVFCVLRMCE